MDIGIQIGAAAKTVAELTNGIIKILEVKGVDQQTLHVALEVLKSGTSVMNTTIHSCTLNGVGGKK